jgi:luciferase family oxidoreductase group 1
LRKLSILEFGQVINCNEVTVLEQTIHLAEKAENLGYTRFWLAEHHEQGVAWRSPEILISILAGSTKKIKIGSGGMLLPINSPLRVAQNFKLLSTLFPDRIDLGIAKGITKNKEALNELLNGVSVAETINNHNLRVQNTIKYLKEDVSQNLESEPIYNSPIGGCIPDIWILGSSGASMDLAIKEKSNYSFSLFHDTKTKIEEKRDTFNRFPEKSFQTNGSVAESSIAITVICGRNKNECDKIYKNHRGSLDITVIGDKMGCFNYVNDLFEQFKVQEIMIYFVCDSLQNKEYCYESFSDLYELNKCVEQKQESRA